jgi:PEP-CTERM motif
MKLSRIIVPCMTFLLAAAPSLRADTVNVSVWEVPAFQNVPAPGSAIYGTAPTFSGTMSNAASVFNMNSSSGGNPLANYTVTSFLTSGGNTLTGTIGGATAMMTPLDTPMNCNTQGTPACVTDSLFEFSGPLNLTSSLALTVAHDDGFYVADNSNLGSPFCSFPAPTSQVNSPCMIPAGNYAQIDVFFAEVDGAPAIFGTIGPSLRIGEPPVPEPSSIALFGTGLIAAAGLLRRRLFS